jgi:hypothetical protein
LARSSRLSAVTHSIKSKVPSASPDPKTGPEKEKQLGDERSDRPKNIETDEAPIDGHHVILHWPDYFETKTFNTKKDSKSQFLNRLNGETYVAPSESPMYLRETSSSLFGQKS